MKTTRTIKIQLAVFAMVSLVAAGFMLLGYMRVPALLSVGYYDIAVALPQTGGLYERANVTYRGTVVGRVKDVGLTDTGVRAELSLRSDVPIPSDVYAEVHSANAVGEQYIALVPRDGNSAPLSDGYEIPLSRSVIQPDINDLLGATNRGLQAIPQDNLRVAIDEAYTAVGGLGPEIQRFIKGSTTLAVDARNDIDALTALIDRSQPVLDSQTQTSESVEAWAARLASLTGQLRQRDDAVRGVLEQGAGAADEARALFQRLQPTLPLLLANLVSIADVGVVYRNDLEQLLVVMPQATAAMQGVMVPSRDTMVDYKGVFLSFNLNLNLPGPCTTGYLPAQQRRSPTFEDYPERPPGDLYCRIPQDSPNNVRGVRNTPCETRPGKRSPTAALCESDEVYVPLNEGENWKGDPNATLSGQDIPHLPPEAPEAAGPATPAQALPIPVAEYDPATGLYIGPDGQARRQGDLVPTAPTGRTWQGMLVPPGA